MKRILCLFFVTIFLISALALPVSATGVLETQIHDFYQWFADGFWDGSTDTHSDGSGWSSGGFGGSTDYDDYVSSLPSSAVTSGGAYRLYYAIKSYDVYSIGSVLVEPVLHTTSFYGKFVPTNSSYSYVAINLDDLVAPFSGTYSAGNEMVLNGCFDKNMWPPYESGTCVQGNKILYNDASTACRIYTLGDLSVPMFMNCRFFVDIIPGDVDFVVPSSSTRVGSITTNDNIGFAVKDSAGNYTAVSGDNNGKIFNEDNSTIYNPVTGDTTTVNNWTYDYSTRTYTGTTDSGTMSVQYGDDCVVINGDGSSYNVYYYSISEAGGSGDDDDDDDDDDDGSGSSIWDKIGKLLGSVLSGIIDLINGILGKVLDALTDLVNLLAEKFGAVVDAVLSIFEKIPPLFAGFVEFLSSTFAFLPDELILILEFGLIGVTFVAIFRMFLNR